MKFHFFSVLLQCKPELKNLKISNYFIEKRQSEIDNGNVPKSDKIFESGNNTNKNQTLSEILVPDKKEMKVPQKNDYLTTDLTHSCTTNSIAMTRKSNNIMEFSFKVCFVFLNFFKSIYLFIIIIF